MLSNPSLHQRQTKSVTANPQLHQQSSTSKTFHLLVNFFSSFQNSTNPHYFTILEEQELLSMSKYIPTSTISNTAILKAIIYDLLKVIYDVDLKCSTHLQELTKLLQSLMSM